MNINSTNSSVNNSGCPLKMSDGRPFTDYRPRCAINADLMTDLDKNNMIKSSYESRMYLQHNAEKIIEANTLEEAKEALALEVVDLSTWQIKDAESQYNNVEEVQ